jgi:multiple sugar transport system substrate-binding protein
MGSHEWYHVLDDFLQGRTAMAIDSSNFATDISNPAKSRVTRQAEFAAFPHAPGRAPVPLCRTGRRALIPNHETSAQLSCS